MRINPKRTAAINLLVAKDIWPVNYVPFGLRFLWRIGIDVPPPYFVRFWGNALLIGIPMTIIYGIIFWLLIWSRHGSSTVGTLEAIGLGLGIGINYALNYKRLRGKYNLPSWDEINSMPDMIQKEQL
jgi:hypothetical protein